MSSLFFPTPRKRKSIDATVANPPEVKNLSAKDERELKEAKLNPRFQEESLKPRATKRACQFSNFQLKTCPMKNISVFVSSNPIDIMTSADITTEAMPLLTRDVSFNLWGDILVCFSLKELLRNLFHFRDLFIAFELNTKVVIRQ